MNKSNLIRLIHKKKSFLCVGLDPDLSKIPPFILEMEDPIFEFNKRIIDATQDLCVAYKPNIAFYECLGAKGWESLKKTVDYISDDAFLIADAKRGDIGNTSLMYAKTFFETFNFDAITLSPYMGKDSIEPFLRFKDKWAIMLALTSNQSAKDIQSIQNSDGEKLYQSVIKNSTEWSSKKNMMYVVGANREDDLFNIRKIIPDNFILIPGVGTQGGDLKKISDAGMNKNCGIMVNISRSIIYCDGSKNFDKEIRLAAIKVKSQMEKILFSNGII